MEVSEGVWMADCRVTAEDANRNYCEVITLDEAILRADGYTETDVANVTLAAAAKQMYAALKGILEDFDNSYEGPEPGGVGHTWHIEADSIEAAREAVHKALKRRVR